MNLLPASTSYLSVTPQPVPIPGNNDSWSCPPSDLSEELLRHYYANIIILSVLFVCATISNFCVIVAVWQRRKKLTRMHMFILHLAFADIIVAMFQVLPELLIKLLCGFHASDGMCRLVKFLQVVGMYGSTYVLVCTAMDRYLAIKNPLQTFKQSKKRVHLTIFAAWILSITLSSPQLFLFRIDAKNELFCGMKPLSQMGVRIYVTWYFVSILAFPFAVLSYFYGMIAILIYKNVRDKTTTATANKMLLQSRNGHGHGEFSLRASNVRMACRAKIKTVKMTFVIVILYVLCYTPFFTSSLLGIWGVIEPSGFFSELAHHAASLNSCVNPWVYMFFSGHLLQELKNLFLCRKRRRKELSQISRAHTSTTNV